MDFSSQRDIVYFWYIEERHASSRDDRVWCNFWETSRRDGFKSCSKFLQFIVIKRGLCQHLCIKMSILSVKSFEVWLCFFSRCLLRRDCSGHQHEAPSTVRHDLCDWVICRDVAWLIWQMNCGVPQGCVLGPKMIHSLSIEIIYAKSSLSRVVSCFACE